MLAVAARHTDNSLAPDSFRQVVGSRQAQRMTIAARKSIHREAQGHSAKEPLPTQLASLRIDRNDALIVGRRDDPLPHADRVAGWNKHRFPIHLLLF